MRKSSSGSVSTPSSFAPSASSKRMRSNAAGARTDVAWEYGLDLGLRRVKCKFCEEEFTGGLFRFKHHLARTHQNVRACTCVPEDVKVKMQKILEQNELNSKKRKGVFMIEEVEQPFKRGKVQQNTLNKIFKKDEREKVCQQIASPKGTIFLASIDTSDISKTKEKVFAMLDDFVEKIGEEHVVQVVTDNAVNYKAAGEMLMDKRKKLFWTPCVTHCIDLMLEDIEKKIEEHKVTIEKMRKVVSFIYNRTRLICLLKEFSKGKELLRPGATRFATSYLTLCQLYELKDSPTMGFILDAMINAKKEIKFMYKDVQSRPLHVAGYYLNLQMQNNLEDCGFSKSTFYKCLEKMCGDENLSKKIDLQITKENEDLTNVYENESSIHGDSGDDDFLEEAIRNQYGGNEQSREESIYVFEEENEVDAMEQLEIID
nr:SCAN domain-containing protein [Tanacetum cinerariifolium]GEV20950.1 SCAN domain-containing protein [Tanacetum cinerariifolium]